MSSTTPTYIAIGDEEKKSTSESKTKIKICKSSSEDEIPPRTDAHDEEAKYNAQCLRVARNSLPDEVNEDTVKNSPPCLISPNHEWIKAGERGFIENEEKYVRLAAPAVTAEERAMFHELEQYIQILENGGVPFPNSFPLVLRALNSFFKDSNSDYNFDTDFESDFEEENQTEDEWTATLEKVEEKHNQDGDEDARDLDLSSDRSNAEHSQMVLNCGHFPKQVSLARYAALELFNRWHWSRYDSSSCSGDSSSDGSRSDDFASPAYASMSMDKARMAQPMELHEAHGYWSCRARSFLRRIRTNKVWDH